MNELFCPQHGIPALVAWVFLGMDLNLLLAFVRMFWERLWQRPSNT